MRIEIPIMPSYRGFFFKKNVIERIINEINKHGYALGYSSIGNYVERNPFVLSLNEITFLGKDPKIEDGKFTIDIQPIDETTSIHSIVLKAFFENENLKKHYGFGFSGYGTIDNRNVVSDDYEFLALSFNEIGKIQRNDVSILEVNLKFSEFEKL
jgi:hypothetical protein